MLDSRVYCTYSSFEVFGSDTEADGYIEADSRGLVFLAQHHLRVNILRQKQKPLDLNHWTRPTAHRTHSEK